MAESPRLGEIFMLRYYRFGQFFMTNRYLVCCVSLLCTMFLANCGLIVPDIKEPWDADKPPDAAIPAKFPGAAQLEFEVKKRIYCDLKEAVQEVNKVSLMQNGKPTGLLPSNWGAQVSLSFQVDETTALNPGAAVLTTLPNVISYPSHNSPLGVVPATITPQSFGFGFGGTLSSTATRVDKFDPYYSIAYLSRPDTPRSVCYPGKPYTEHDHLFKGWVPPASSPFIIESDLGIKDWLLGAMLVDNFLPSEGPPPQGGGGGAAPSGKDTVSIEIKFVIITSANATPTWKLVRVSANTGATPFFTTGRTRTHDLIITIGAPSPVTTQTHLASQIGNAVSNANRAIFNPNQ
jgi:hypothetical protein